jgi:DNA-binding transcriptional regulator YiaG
LPFCHIELRAARGEPAGYPSQINSLGDHIRACRLDRKLLQEHVAEQIGVHKMTITSWERNATIPAIRYIPVILAFLGYDPFPPASTLSARLVAVRRMLGLSQRKLALSLGIDSGTLQSWEAGQHKPTGRSVVRVERLLESFGVPSESGS